MSENLPAPAFATRDLLAWYDIHARELPWRVAPHIGKSGMRQDPYRVWLSEVMLQQTTVAAVKDYYAKFLALWPTLNDLAAAELDDVLRAWAGLGYYSRARNLKACADAIVADHGGRFPENAVALRQLPGIGDYTSAAIAAIAFGEAVPVVDGNVERVITRVMAMEMPLPEAKKPIKAVVGRLVPPDRPGDFAQALMDLGATICTPRKPACVHCPLRAYCHALDGDPERFPVKRAKADKPVRRGAAFVAVGPDGSVLVERRAASGLLGGMTQVPTTNWTSRQDGETSVAGAPFAAKWTRCGEVTHIFTHFELRLAVWRTDCAKKPYKDGWWSAPHALDGEALPTLMRKVLAEALARKERQPKR